MAELEESRRKLINLKMQKDVASGMHIPPSGAVNGNLSPEKSAERTISLRDLKNSIEETKVYMLFNSPPCFLSYSLNHFGTVFQCTTQMLATNRLSELTEAQGENLTLSKQLEDLQVGNLDFFIFQFPEIFSDAFSRSLL